MVAEIVYISSKFSPSSIYGIASSDNIPPIFQFRIWVVHDKSPRRFLACRLTDCALCADGMAQEVMRSCHKCSGKSARSGVCVLVVLLTLVIILVVSVTSHLLEEINPEDDHANEEEHKARPRKHRLLLSGRNLLAKVFPNSAIRTVVVVLEIISQVLYKTCLLYTSPSPRDKRQSRMPSSA